MLAKFILIFSLAIMSNASWAKTVFAYYMKLDIETYIPVTTSTIKAASQEKWINLKKIQSEQLEKILTTGEKAKFNANKVRGLFLISNHVYYMDSNGVVVKKNRVIKINVSSLKKFIEQIRPDQKEIMTKN